MKIKNTLTTLKKLSALIAPAIFSAFIIPAHAAPFIAGNLAVMQAGDGSAALSGAAAPQFVLEYLPSTASQSGPVQTIAIPTNGATRLTIGGSSTSEGHIARSTDGSIVVFQGYDTNAGPSAPGSGTAATTPRYVGQLDANGNYTRTAAGGATEFTTGSIRSTISDGANYWMSGSGSSAGEGIWYSAGGATPVAITTGANTRVTRIFNGKLYYTTSTALSGYSSVPTATATATATGISGSSLYEFAFNPAGNVAYVCDDSAVGSSVGGIAKWTNNGTTWVKAFTFGSSANTASNGLTAGCRGMVVDFSGANPVIYATTADTLTKLIKITDTSAFTATSDSADQATTLAVAPNSTVAFRGVAFVPPSSSTGTAPAITGISPTSVTNSPGTNVSFTLSGGVGYPTAAGFWYKIVGSTTNLVSGQTNAILALTNVQASDTAQYFAILTNASGSATSSIVSLTVIAKPTITGISPTSATNSAGTTLTFTLTSTPGSPPASNFWYQIVGSTTNLISGATSASLTLSNLLGANSGGYFAILTNASGSATSAVATLTVIDPILVVEPSSVQGLLDGTAQFSVTAAGTTPFAYQWYYSDTNGNIIAPVSDGALGGSVISGATSNLLTIANLQSIDVTNFMVIATNNYGAVTSSVASFLSSSVTGTLPATQGMLALWDFDGTQFTNTAINPNSIISPAPFIGYGTASAVGSCLVPGTSPFSGATDPDDIGFVPGLGYEFTPFGFEQPSPNFSWGTEDYPVDGTNKVNGVQFNTSTVGARNIHVTYDGRVSSTASEYFRLQYTTNGTDWVDYPASSSFSGLSSTTGNGGYYTFNYNLVGFPGVDNNPNFGVRVVSEYESSATYGIGTTNYWVAVANNYVSGASGNNAAGTVTYDLVAITGDAITNNNVPPTLGAFANMPFESVSGDTNGTFMGYVTNMVDTNVLVIPFTASSSQMPASKLTFSVQSLDTVSAGGFGRTINPQFNVVNTGGNNFTLSINFAGNFIPDPMDAAPILLTVTDTNGLSASSWFLLTAAAINQPPTNSLTLVQATNMLANTSLSIPFTVGSSTNNPNSNFTFTVTSDNNTVIPSGNIVISGNTNTGNLVLTITPAANEVGNTVISIAVDDNNSSEPRTTTANIACVVRPNTNVVAVDYFNYDTFSGALDTVGAPYWTHLSGNTGGLQVGNGAATISDGDTENMEAQLLGSPYTTNNVVNKVLYYSCTIDMTTLPYTNGSYVIAFNDGSGVTADVEGLLVATTNGAAAGDYRLGIDNIVGATGANAQLFPVDLVPDTTNVVVVALNLANGFSTLWVNPTNQASQSVSDNTPAASQTNLFNISEIELRESGTSEGVMSVARLTVGTAFSSVFYPPQANPDTFGITENSSGNVLSPVLNDGGSELTITSVSPDANGTATVSNGTNIIYSATNTDYTGAASVGYTVTDDLGETSSSTITLNITNIPPLANPATYSVTENSANDAFNVLTNDVLETSGGTLGLVSASETDGNGTATKSGNNVIFTPTANFVGTATINYTITDNIGGTSSSTITVNVSNVTSIPVSAALVSNGSLVLTWANPAFSLQTTTNLLTPWITVVGATSPYTNMINGNTNAAFFRLVH
ncbi:MAG TPA: Ig-like domain-containing protein [Verrucomicrobiae bacterium]